jgi:hypothetical protein
MLTIYTKLIINKENFISSKYYTHRVWKREWVDAEFLNKSEIIRRKMIEIIK